MEMPRRSSWKWQNGRLLRLADFNTAWNVACLFLPLSYFPFLIKQAGPVFFHGNNST
jgi:hypothetical protein